MAARQFLAPAEVLPALNSHKYTRPHDALRDMQTVMANYRQLQPCAEVFTHQDGEQYVMVNLTGTVPIVVNGQTYNIPIRIWLYKEHPARAPICYVDPTPDMEVKPARHVDVSGLVYHPYLANWAKSAVQSNLTDFTMTICGVFATQPPVFSRPVQPPHPVHVEPVYAPPPYVPPARAAAVPVPPSPVLPARREEEELDKAIVRVSALSGSVDHILRRLKPLHAAVSRRTEDMLATRERLVRGSQTLDKMVGDLREDQRSVGTALAAIAQQKAPLEAVLGDMGGADAGVVNVDDLIAATAPVYTQLLELLAADNAIDDTLYHLAGGLKNKTLTEAIYLRKIAELSRAQFQVRALLLKVRQVAGLPE